MHYYQFNIGDYRKDTGHLSLLEHGIYRMLLDTYYLNEAPLDLDKKTLMRTHCVRSADEVQAFENVLADFFEATKGGYFHKGCNKEMQRIYEKSEKARQAAVARWGEKSNKNNGDNGEECERNADALHGECERNADGMLPITHNPLPKDIAASGKPESDPPPKKKKRKSAITLKNHLETLRAAGEKPFRPDDPIYDYAEGISLPSEFLYICWFEFKDRHTTGSESSKRQSDWRATFRNCVRGNWYGLWWADNVSGEYVLTTKGHQAKRNMEAKRAA